ncbi:capsular polysaccharide export protein, LipB/KpsS family [Humitalea rosea]|uniref:capsular polysaccharide export protein, LipB/KpsS family n=1 Tax=Humitalea rosea TaxID=990373 RepID=UPI0013144C8E|nr:hypothetical protein [Humitalea rosea]
MIARLDPLAAAAVPAEAERLGRLVALRRVGGPAGLPDPGPVGLGLPARGALLLLDACEGTRSPCLREAIDRLLARAAGRPVVVLPHPGARRSRPLRQAPKGVTVLPWRFSAWTLLDAAAELHLLPPATPAVGPDPLLVLAGAAGVPAWSDEVPVDVAALWASVIGATRWRCPFHGTEMSAEAGIGLLALWRITEAHNRRVAACTGIPPWKRASMAALFASGRGAPAFRGAAGAALKHAERKKGALAAWASSMPVALPDAASAAGVALLRIEDGFIRGAGLGARFLPGASWCIDGQGVHYDPARPSDLEALLQEGGFEPALLARAAALRQTIVARGISKYNLRAGAPMPAFPAGRRIVLVTGQVEDDASMRAVRGPVRGNLALLRAARAVEPEAFLIFKPHPDLVAGFRRGRLAAEELDGLVDAVVTDQPLPALLPHVHALHTITSLAGFEALLRGVPVTTWGQPAYAGWGLTLDRDPVARRTRKLTLDELVAGMLILYPRYLDPVTRLPCTPEVLLERLDDPALWRASPFTIHRGVQGFVTRLWARWRGLS